MSPHSLDYLDGLFWLSMSPKSSHYTERGSSKKSSLEILPSHVRHASTISCVPPLVTWWKERDRGAGPIYILCWRINANQLVFCCKHRWCISWCISITFSQCICSRDGAWWLHKEMLWGDSHQHCTKRPKCATSDLDALQETSMEWYKKMRANISWICPSGQVV